jgi:hypothetical protein
MNNIHLTDEILQEFLLKENEDESIVAHLSACSACQERLAAYQYLIESLPKMEAETFPFDVTSLAMDNVLLYEQKKSQKQELAFGKLLILLIIVILSFAMPFIPKVLVILNSTSIFTTLLAVVIGLAIFLFLLADLTQQYKIKEEKIFNSNLQPIL